MQEKLGGFQKRKDCGRDGKKELQRTMQKMEIGKMQRGHACIQRYSGCICIGIRAAGRDNRVSMQCNAGRTRDW